MTDCGAVRPLAVLDLGLVPYATALELQRRLVALRARDAVEDALLLLQHPPTITVSDSGRGRENIVADAAALAARGVVVEATDRGGNVTLHAPGQLVGYPILKLAPGEQDLDAYLRALEAGLIAVAATFGVDAVRVPGRTGVWLPGGGRKLAAIGVRMSRWVTSHGFAINVDNDLSLFDLIVPCGLRDAGVARLAGLCLVAPSVADVAAAVRRALPPVWGRRVTPASPPLRAACALDLPLLETA